MCLLFRDEDNLSHCIVERERTTTTAKHELLYLTYLWSHPQDLIEEMPEEAARRRAEILRRLAFHQFTLHKFQESLKNYLEIEEGMNFPTYTWTAISLPYCFMHVAQPFTVQPIQVLGTCLR